MRRRKWWTEYIIKINRNEVQLLKNIYSIFIFILITLPFSQCSSSEIALRIFVNEINIVTNHNPLFFIYIFHCYFAIIISTVPCCKLCARNFQCWFNSQTTFHLTLWPSAVKRRWKPWIGLRRPRAKTIIEGMYDRRRELSLVPAYEICVCEWRGAPCT